MKEDLSRSAFEHSSLSMLISAARRHVKHAVVAMGEPYGLNPYQCWIVILLHEQGPMSLSELAGRMWMDHPTTSRLVHAMEDAGLLQILQDPSHGRKVLIGIHPERMTKADEICAKSAEFRDQMAKGLSEDEQKIMKSALCKVIENLSGLLDEAKPGQGKLDKREMGQLVAS